jgi:hypothetical protein
MYCFKKDANIHISTSSSPYLSNVGRHIFNPPKYCWSLGYYFQPRFTRLISKLNVHELLLSLRVHIITEVSQDKETSQ